MNQDIPNELLCPISMDLLEDPITLPCCGRGVSRESIIASFAHNPSCPLCRNDLGGFNPLTAPKSINLSYIIDEFKNGLVQLFQPKPKQESKWKAVIHKICNNDSVSQKVIGKLVISNTDESFNFKTLLIPIVDESGSMSGSPTRQVKYSLHRVADMTYKYPQILTHIIGYSDNTISLPIDKTLPQQFHRDSIEKIGRGGGTSFKAAFEEIVKVLNKYNSDTNITSVVGLFLTDGQDSSVQKSARGELISKLKLDIAKVWNKPYTMHSVGFTNDHDYDFLNGLRQIGTTEGAYRFADPNEDSDSLSNKINSLLDVIAETSSIPLEIVGDTFPIINGENGTYWVNLSGMDLTKDYEINVSVNHGEPISIMTEYAEDENDSEVWSEWYSFLIDKIAEELLLLSQQPGNALDKQLHCVIIQQRAQAIFAKIGCTNSNTDRLEKLMETLKTLQSGGTVSQQKLNDMKFEGKYATAQTNKPTLSLPTTQNAIPSYSWKPPKYCAWNTIRKPAIKRCKSVNTDTVFEVIGSYNSNDAVSWLYSNSYGSSYDDNGASALIVASSIGRYGLVKAILCNGCCDHYGTNNLGYNALDMAILFGYWNTTTLLIDHDCKPTININTLFQTCLSNKFFNTAKVLIEKGLVEVTDDMVDGAPTSSICSWLSGYVKKEISIETAISKGMFDVVKSKINQIKTISWKSYLDILMKPTDDHLKVIDFLLKNNKADPNETIDTIVVNTEGISEKEITWPLFVACEKGQQQLFSTLMKYISKESLDKQNLKGTTCLWIACCNRNADIVIELLGNGANPNLANFKGDGPLIPSCQKGSETIVEMLLESGARMDCYNKNRDNCILISCRTGQAKVLDMLLKRLDDDNLKLMLETYAEIDQFAPLAAATELDKVECIRVCHKFGADLELRIPNDNQMVPGGTPLHLACYYGKTNAAKCLVELGSNIKSQTLVHGHTPLHIAIKQGHIHTVRYLLSLNGIKDCMTIKDYDGRVPSYFAGMAGNEEIMEEFFTNKLSVYMGKLLHAGNDMEKKCADVLVKYGCSPLCYEYSDIANTNISDGATVLSYALLNGNKHLITSLQQMGADFTKVDDFGISPQFWATYLGYNTGLNPNPDILEKINKIKEVSQKNIQNKMLTNLQQNTKSIEYHPTETNVLIKMADGFGLKVKNDMIDILKGGVGVDYSLLGFVDKLKNSKKEFPEGNEIISYLFWDAKINIIRRIATDESKLSPVHLLALYLYTGNSHIFKQVNKTLLNWQSNTLWQPFINCLYQAVNLIDVFDKEVYRAVDIPFNLEDYKIGNKIVWNTFSVTSYEWKSANDLINLNRGIIFVVKGKTGRNISKYSKNPVECEVMFLPGTEFTITNYYVASATCLGQENIRKTTFKITEKEILKAVNQQAAIIVELTEVIDNTEIEELTN